MYYFRESGTSFWKHSENDWLALGLSRYGNTAEDEKSNSVLFDWYIVSGVKISRKTLISLETKSDDSLYNEEHSL